ncbi:MAG TPA: ferric reductase-like transmembrane domain-containing protein [Thermoleophilaceae bacterium]
MSTLLATATGPHLFWITSRAAGTAALLLSSLGVCVGLLMSGRFMRGRGADLRPLHEALSLATIAALLVHGLSLLGDKYLHPSLIDVAVPFAGSYKTGWTSLGIIAAYALILLGPSYYMRRAIGQKRWVKLHRFTAVAWIAGIVHAIGEGTDASSAWFVVLIAMTTIPALLLLTLRNFQGSVAK